MIWTCLVFYGAIGLVFVGMVAIGDRLLDLYDEDE